RRGPQPNLSRRLPSAGRFPPRPPPWAGGAATHRIPPTALSGTDTLPPSPPRPGAPLLRPRRSAGSSGPAPAPSSGPQAAGTPPAAGKVSDIFQWRVSYDISLPLA